MIDVNEVKDKTVGEVMKVIDGDGFVVITKDSVNYYRNEEKKSEVCETRKPFKVKAKKVYTLKNLLISSFKISIVIATLRICLWGLYIMFSLKLFKMTEEKLIHEYVIGSSVIFMKAFSICLIISLSILLIQTIRQKYLGRNMNKMRRMKGI